MLSDVLKCSLVILLTYAFFASSDARATNNADSSGTFSRASASASAGTGISALSGTNAFTSAFAKTDSNSNRDAKSLSRHRGIKSDGHDYNKEGDGCSKCKWENDDYWERDEPEEDGNENDGDECDDSDDGQYKLDKMHHHGGSGFRGHESESHPLGVHKTGPTGIYGDNIKGGVKGGKPDGPFGATNIPGNIGYAGSINGYGSTPRPEFIWNTSFTDTSKPGFGDVTANTFITTPSYRPKGNWNGRTTLAGFTSNSAWSGGHGNIFAGNFGTTPNPTWNIGYGSTSTTTGFSSSQKPELNWNIRHDNMPTRSYETTLKPTTWNTGTSTITGGFPVSQKSGASWSSGYNSTPVRNYGTTPRPGHGWNTGFSNNPRTEFPFSRKPALNWKPNYSGTLAVSFGTTPKPGSSWNTSTDTSTTGFPSSQKPMSSWNADHNNTDQSFGITSKPGLNRNTGSSAIARFPFSQKPAILWSTGRDSTSIRNFESTVNPRQNQNTGFGGIFGSSSNPNQGTTSVDTSGCIRPHTSCNQGNLYSPVKVGATPFDSGLAKNDKSTSNISPAASYVESGINGAHAGADVISNFESMSHGEVPGLKQNEHPFGFDKPISTQATYDNSNANAGTGVTSNFGNTPYNGAPIFGQPRHPFGFDKSISTLTPYGTHGNTFNPGKSPKSPAEDSIHRHPEAFKPSYRTENIATSSWSNAGHIGTESSIRPASGTTHLHTEFPVTNPSTLSIHAGSSSYSGIKNSFGSTKSTYGTGPLGTQFDGGIRVWSSKPGDGSGIWPRKQPGIGSETRLGIQPGGNAPWLSKQPENNIMPGHFGSETGTWSSGKPGNENVIRPGGYLGDNSETWSGTKSGSSITPDHSVIGISPAGYSTKSNIWPTQQPKRVSETWPSGQIGHKSRPECSNGSCGGSIDPYSGSNSCGGNNNCGGSCSGKSNNVPTIYRSCGGTINRPSGVNKTYYPAGTGDGNVPNIANTYKPDSFPNFGSGAYLGVNTDKGASVTPEGPIQWNSANPFLYRSVGGIPKDASHSWSETTLKPIGKGNPFLNSSWGNPKPDDNNANNDKNMILFRQENTKPFNKENPFLNDNKRRGDIEINTEQVTSLGERKPEGSNPFGAPFSSGSSGSSLYNEYPTRSPESGLPGSSDYGNVKSDLQPERVPAQGENSDIFYPVKGSTQGIGPLQCKFGFFGCGTPGSGSFAATKGGKHPGEGIGGNIEVGTGGLGSVNSSPGELRNSGTGVALVSDNYGGGAYTGSFSNAQAYSFSFANAKSLSSSGAGGHSNNFGQANSGSRFPSAAQNQGEPNPWAFSGASAFASSNARNWPGNYSVDIKG